MRDRQANVASLHPDNHMEKSTAKTPNMQLLNNKVDGTSYWSQAIQFVYFIDILYYHTTSARHAERTKQYIVMIEIKKLNKVLHKIFPKKEK